MQKLIYIRRSHGKSQKSGKDYDLTEVSDGMQSFVLNTAEGIGGRLAKNLAEGDSFMVEVHVKSAFGGLRGTIVDTDVTE